MIHITDKDVYENLCVLAEQLPVDYQEVLARTVRAMWMSPHSADGARRWLVDAGYVARERAR